MNINDYQGFDKYAPFRANLETLIKSHGMTARQLCLATGISVATMSRYLNIKRIPDMIYIYAIADYFNVSIDWILGRTQPNEQLPKEQLELLRRYSISSDTDKLVINTILGKYE